MRILVFSDSHFSISFDEKKFNALKKVIEKADQVIIAGDFWDGYLSTFDAFVNSPWKDKLFPLLKSKKSVYLYGNHDKQKYSDERTNLFSDAQARSYQFSMGDKTFIIEHGDRIAPLIDMIIPFKWITFFTKLHDFFEKTVISIWGENYYRWLHAPVNNRIKLRAKKKLKDNEVFICGHTHYAELDLANHFVNAGVNKHGLAQHVWIEDGNITLEKGTY
jgi:predicted phosphodiesterase